MEQKSDHAQVIVNPFLIYIASALIAPALQKIIPLPFLEKTPAQAIGAILIISNLIAGLPALVGMISVLTSPTPCTSVSYWSIAGWLRSLNCRGA